jgi:DNA mismatch repair protein MutL
MAIPLSLELDQGQVTALKKNLPLLESLGFALEPFGGAYLLRAAPAWGGDGSGDRTLLDVLDALLDKGSFTRTDLVDRLVITWSCKGAVKAGKRLEYAEMTALVKQLARTKAPYTCPHGRPTVICIEERELLSRFKRIV